MKKNNLLDWCKDNGKEYLINEWDAEKNRKELGLEIEDVSYTSHKKVYWKCAKHGHEWMAKIASRTNGKSINCPICVNRKLLVGYNDLKSWSIKNDLKYLIEEWDDERNEKELGITSEDVVYGSTIKAYWKCEKNDKHKWEALVLNRTREDGAGCLYCDGKMVLPGDNDLKTWCLNNDRGYLLEEWDDEKNEKLFNITTETVTRGSSKKAYWICQNNHSHKWKALIKSRTQENGTNCPFCNIQTSVPEQFLYEALNTKFKNVSNRVMVNGYEYDIYIEDLNLLIEYDGVYWHRMKLDKSEREAAKEVGAMKCGYDFLKISETKKKIVKIQGDEIITMGDYNKKSLYKTFSVLIDYINEKYSLDIDKHLEENILMTAKRNTLTDQKENSLAVTHPHLIDEWDDERNEIKPHQVTFGSNVIVWWKCENDDRHKWQASIISRAGADKSGCPICSGHQVLKGYNDLATLFPEDVKDWDKEKNIMKPDEITGKSSKIVWWKCHENDKHQWSSTVYAKTKKTKVRCPFCAGRNVLAGDNDLATTHPEALEEWDFSRNKIKPTEVAANTGKKVYWKCKKDGHIWEATVRSRVTMNTGCPKCKPGRLESKMVYSYDKVENVYSSFESIREASKETGYRSLLHHLNKEIYENDRYILSLNPLNDGSLSSFI